MEDLPEHLLLDILKRIDRTADRNSISVVCKRLHRAEAEQRDVLRVGCGLHPAIEAFTALCSRFQNLLKLEINYTGWKPALGEQLGNEALQVLSSNCTSLKELSLSFCAFIDDAAIWFLSSCPYLTSLTLNFVPSISSTGILSAVNCCKNLSTLHLIRCMTVSSTEWLEHLGKSGNLRELSIKNCRGISEVDIIKLGPGWKKLRKLDFAVDAYYQYPNLHDRLLLDELDQESVSCDELRELSLTNCIVAPGHGLSFLLRKCAALEKLLLNMCIGVMHSDFVALSKKSSNLRALTVRLPLRLHGSILENNHLPLRDGSLRALAAGCPMLNTLDLSFSDWDYPSASFFTQEALIAVIQCCPIHALKLHCAVFFNDIGMRVLGASQCLQVLELSKCHNVTDRGLAHIIKLPSIKTVKLFKCVGVSDIGLNPLVDTHKLDLLAVEDCPYITDTGIKGAAKSIVYKQDLSWMY
ncbi:F-box/LRR-repeat protein 14 [Phalaenopsis equestris]|uniref:F-box/LRR-repeat protein 14 n=1 Tax=Phalaenopsis equestris TaxID=78828 RepID=UPI0009E314CC|nr:F-box/LRR-repeat protein 14 [Phalaenopsis equestris]